ncbi:MAG: hypothetical protein KKA42_12255 [candidate division Zixibacteria bacterium]|nr:hypothetical protein [candidate division Zixibacteria bacterium]
MKRLLLCTVFVLLLLSHGVAQDDVITFTFDPPDGLTFMAQTVSERVRIMDTSKVIDSNWTFSSHRFSHTVDGFELSSTVDSSGLSRNGSKLNDPMLRMFEHNTVTHVIDAEGRSVGVRGYHELIARMDSLLSPEQAEVMKQTMMNPRTLELKEIAEWNGRIGRLAGASVSFDHAVYGLDSVALPSGATLQLFGALELVDTVRIGERLFAKVNIAAYSDPTKMYGHFKLTVDDLKSIFGLTDSTIAEAAGRSVQSASVSELLIEVATCLVREEQLRRNLLLTLPSRDGSARRTSLVETTYKKFWYNR